MAILPRKAQRGSHNIQPLHTFWAIAFHFRTAIIILKHMYTLSLKSAFLCPPIGLSTVGWNDTVQFSSFFIYQLFSTFTHPCVISSTQVLKFLGSFIHWWCPGLAMPPPEAFLYAHIPSEHCKHSRGNQTSQETNEKVEMTSLLLQFCWCRPTSIILKATLQKPL